MISIRRSYCIPIWLLAVGACSAPMDGPAAESVGSTESALTVSVAGVGSASPQTGTSLPLNTTPTRNVVLPATSSFGVPVLDVPGISNNVNWFPPDPNGDVGPRHYVQAVNQPAGSLSAFVTIYDKSGTPVSPQVTDIPLAQLVTTSGQCGNAHGDMVVNYDRQADRWLISEIANVSNDLCVYVSQTGDPTALDKWTLYDFAFGSLVDVNGNPAPGGFPDYAKLAVWGDAYYVTVNDLSSPQVPAVYALQRSAMLAGTTAKVQRFVLPVVPGVSGFQPATPADVDSPLGPPAGAPGLILRRVQSSTPSSNGVEVWSLHVDFTTPASSTLTGPSVVQTASFNDTICAGGAFPGDCVPQPSPGSVLSDVGEFVMLWRAQYRNFGDHESIVGTWDVSSGQTVNGQPVGAPHWVELRRTGGASSSWSLVQEQTYAPDTSYRFDGSIAMDQFGNIGFGYSVSSSTVDPSIRYTGRKHGDPLGQLTQSEAVIVSGTGVQTGGDRWGDYTAMQVDPSDDCTFWYTDEYYAATSSTGWTTRIGALRFPFPTCVPTNGVCVRTTDSLHIDDRAIVSRGALPNGVLANSGNNQVQVGVTASVGDILSVGSVTLADRSVVQGLIQTGGTLTRGNQVTVTGPITTGSAPALPPAIDLSTVVFPPTVTPVTVNGGQQVSIAPGGYGAVTVFSGGVLELSSGDYFFASLDIEPQAQVQVNQASGPVAVFVRNSVIYRGPFVVPGGGRLATVAVGYVGTSPVVLENNFDGTFVAPSASLTLGTDTTLTFVGEFQAKDFELRPGSSITCDPSANAAL